MLPPSSWMSRTTSGVSGIGSWPYSRDEALVPVADAEDAAHAVAVVQGHHQGADHVVDARAQAAAGHDGGCGLLRVEEDALPRDPAASKAGRSSPA